MLCMHVHMTLAFVRDANTSINFSQVSQHDEQTVDDSHPIPSFCQLLLCFSSIQLYWFVLVFKRLFISFKVRFLFLAKMVSWLLVKSFCARWLTDGQTDGQLTAAIPALLLPLRCVVLQIFLDRLFNFCPLTLLRCKYISGRRGVVITRLIRSAKLLYAGPG